MVLAITAACGGTSTSHRATNRATPLITDTPLLATDSPSATATPAATATPTATAGLPLTAVAFSCRLPVVTTVGQTPGGVSQTASAGFISFPSASFSPDPGGSIKSKAFGLAYDRVYSRWLPVDWRLVSDDGAHYVYVTYSEELPNPGAYSIIHIVDVGTGADRVVSRTGQYVVNDYVGTGVYLSAWVGGHDGPGPQIASVLDSSTGAVRALAKGYGYWIGSGAGWRTDYNTADPTVHQGMTGPNRLTRVDLNTGAEATWLYQQGADWLQVLGFDRDGHPIVSSGIGQVITVWLLTDATHRSQLFSGSTFVGWATADSNGIWFSDGSATYLYTASSGFRKVAATGGQIAGGCH
jgi:hypothetical protein